MADTRNVPEMALNLILRAREARGSVLALRDRCAENIVTFANVHVAALRIVNVVDVTPITNCGVHVSVVGRDLTNFQLCILGSWTDYEMTPTLTAHFYLATFEFMNRWPQILFEKRAKMCLRQIRDDGFSDEVRDLNMRYEVVRNKWWPQLHAVRNNLAGHYDRDSSKLLGALAEMNLQSCLELATGVNDLLLHTASTLTLIGTEMKPLLERIANE